MHLQHWIVDYDDDVFLNLVFRFFLNREKKENYKLKKIKVLPERSFVRTSVNLLSLFALRKATRGLFEPGILIVVR